MFSILHALSNFTSETKMRMITIYSAPYKLFNLKTKGYENCIQQHAKNERYHFC